MNKLRLKKKYNPNHTYRYLAIVYLRANLFAINDGSGNCRYVA